MKKIVVVVGENKEVFFGDNLEVKLYELPIIVGLQIADNEPDLTIYSQGKKKAIAYFRHFDYYRIID